MRVCGQHLQSEALREIQRIIDDSPNQSRRSLSRQICTFFNWRNSVGAFKEGSCRKALVTLARKGLIDLPEIKETFSFQRKISREISIAAPSLCCDIKEIGDISIIPIGDRRSHNAKIWNTLIDRYHYLGLSRECGAQLRYLITSQAHGYLGAISFRSGILSLAKRDEYIGWSEQARLANIDQIVLNSRFLIVPGVCVKNFASHCLSRIMSRLADDWQHRYGVRPLVVETFVDPTRFDGTCYKAANWICVGQTSGRRDGIAKDIFLYTLSGNWKEQLCIEPALQLAAARRPEQPRSWAEEEFGGCRFADERLKTRLYRVAEDFFDSPLANIPEACGSYAAIKGSYRFFSNKKVTMNVLLTPHVESTINRIREHKVVLVPQDTTTLNYNHLGTDGLGPTGVIADKSIGLILHDTMAFTLNGTPLGVLDAQCWARDADDKGKSKQRREVPIEEKESFKWLKSYRRVAEIQKLCPQTMLVSIGDRESDIYELLVEANKDPDGPRILIRCDRYRQRRIEDCVDDQLWAFMEKQSIAGTMKIHIPKQGNKAARDAVLTIRFAPVVLNPPRKKDLPRLDGYRAVYLVEEDSSCSDRIEWMLLTNAAVTNLVDAKERVEWYAGRWGIEIYHRTLKSGCKILDRQLGTAQSLQACLGVDMVVAWRIYHLTMLGREFPNHPCTIFFEDVEWKALYCHANRSPIPPSEPPTLNHAIRTLGKLGGHLGRKRDGMPGNQCLWRGIQRLDTAADMFVIFTGDNPPAIRKSYPYALQMDSGP
jgi:hypothetical protein